MFNDVSEPGRPRADREETDEQNMFGDSQKYARQPSAGLAGVISKRFHGALRRGTLRHIADAHFYSFLLFQQFHQL